MTEIALPKPAYILFANYSALRKRMQHTTPHSLALLDLIAEADDFLAALNKLGYASKEIESLYESSRFDYSTGLLVK
jgi:Holliday junction resolvasome RuvABC DNA-binding subunit